MMLRNLKLIYFLLLLIVQNQTANSTYAAEAVFQYPELSVVPRASEQVLAESLKQKDQGFKNHLPLLVPATMTFLTGVVELASGTKINQQGFEDTSAKYAPWVGIGVGVAWWAVSLGILNQLDLYDDAAKEIASLPNGTEREKLLKERRAEEAIFKAGSIARRLKWISFGSNLLASGYMAASAKENTASVYVALASGLTSIAPLLFSHRWETLECQQREYKKRIYAPVAGVTFLKNPNSFASLTPGLSLSLNF